MSNSDNDWAIFTLFHLYLVQIQYVWLGKAKIIIETFAVWKYKKYLAIPSRLIKNELLFDMSPRKLCYKLKNSFSLKLNYFLFYISSLPKKAFLKKKKSHTFVCNTLIRLRTLNYDRFKFENKVLETSKGLSWNVGNSINVIFLV